jgi:hypothetical protein
MTVLPGGMRRSRQVGERMGSAKARTPAVLGSGCFGAGFGEGEPLVAEVGDYL